MKRAGKPGSHRSLHASAPCLECAPLLGHCWMLFLFLGLESRGLALDRNGEWRAEMNHPLMSVPRLGGGQAVPPAAPTVTPCLQADEMEESL